MIRKLSSTILAGAALCLVTPGCAGTAEDICTLAAEHLETCMGLEGWTTGTCNLDKASVVLNVPCEKLSATRGLYSFGGGEPPDLMSWLHDEPLDDETVGVWAPDGQGEETAWKFWELDPEATKEEKDIFFWGFMCSTVAGGGAAAIASLCMML
jgi:hypothetical protein